MELLVVIAIIGVLIGLLLPAVQSARETARRTQCQNNLHQLALATELFHDSYQAYPPARYQPRPGDPDMYDCGGEETTWLVRIMPFLEQDTAEQQWDYSMPYGDHVDQTREYSPAVYRCPARRGALSAIGEGVISGPTTTVIVLPCGCRIPIVNDKSRVVTGAVGDYGGNHGDLSAGAFGLPTDFYFGGNGNGLIISSRAKCDSSGSDPYPVTWEDKISHEFVSDGLSNTFLLGEVHVPYDLIGESPGDAFIYNGDQFYNSTRVGGPTVPIITDIRNQTGNALVSWGSAHAGEVCQFAFGDGSVRVIRGSIDTETLGNLCNRNDGQTLPNDVR